MTADTDQPTLAVTQADINAANALDDVLGFLTDLERPLVVKAFARHRTTHEPRPAGDLREALAQIAGYSKVNGMTRRRMRKIAIDALTSSGSDMPTSTLGLIHAMLQPYEGEPSQAGEAFKVVDAALATHSPAPMAGEGWIVGNNVGQWRTFDTFGWAWTDRRDLAVRYARREDAELVHGDDEDSWRVEQYPAAAHPSTQEGADRG